MKIKGILNSEEINTDKMTDVEAEIFEKQHELCLLCEKYDKRSLICIILWLSYDSNKKVGNNTQGVVMYIISKVFHFEVNCNWL